MTIPARAWNDLKQSELRGMVITLMKRCTELERRTEMLEVMNRSREVENEELTKRLDTHEERTDFCPHTGT